MEFTRIRIRVELTRIRIRVELTRIRIRVELTRIRFRVEFTRIQIRMCEKEKKIELQFISAKKRKRMKEEEKYILFYVYEHSEI